MNFKKLSLVLASTLGILALFFLLFSDKIPDFADQQLAIHPKAQNIKDAFEDNFERTKDPALGYPPIERMIDAINETRARQKAYSDLYRSGSVANARFKERGPNNVGGRTRTILIDKNDPSGNTLFIGGVAGGLWKTEDITATPVIWNNVNDYLENLAVGAMAQDPDNPQIMYMGTGEGYPNADAVAGLGIFKSTDGGASWSVLPNTVSGAFRFTRAMVVEPGTGAVMAATNNNGIQRSEDGGNSWTRVLGSTLVATSDNMYDLLYVKGTFYASNHTQAYKSTTGKRGEWTSITLPNSGFPTDLTRVEIAVCESNPSTIYAIGSRNGGASETYRTDDGGTNWGTFARPENGGGGEFTNGQAWYDLDIAVDPFNCNHVIAGGVPIMASNNGGQTYSRFANNMHVDQHKVFFDPAVQNRVFFGNDGGIWYSEIGSANNVQDKNLGYITSQFYACDIHPEKFSNYFLGGTQDNGSLQLQEFGLSSARNVWGGDGFLCHIDQDEPNIQVVSSQFGNYGLSTNGGDNFSGGVNTNGRFLTPSDYDDEANMVYIQTFDGDFYRWNVNSGAIDLVDMMGANLNISTVTADPNVSNRVYFGTFGGQIYRIDNANVGMEVEGELIFNSNGTVSSIDIALGEPDQILVTLSNFGINNNIHLSTNGGESWTGQEGDLPDMPVRWGLFNPRDPTQAIIATEAGVWTTELLNGDNTAWIPPVPGRGSPITRVDMLRIRYSDFVVLAATHGRGLFTTDVFADPSVKAIVNQVHYSDSPLQFIGDNSLNADNYMWTFGDGETSTEENPTHVYDEHGTYLTSLTVNNDLKEEQEVKILLDGELPYIPGEPAYSGSFEGLEEQYGAWSRSGSLFKRGISGVPGKHGTKSGSFAYVLELDNEFYQPNTEAYLYIPNFDFSEDGIYTFRFWANYDIDFGPDGFNVEYSTDRGQSWTVLGKQGDPGWYTANSSDLTRTAFPPNTHYFTGAVGGFTEYQYNVSFLAGEDDVAFRFVFRSESTGNHRGMAIDDVEISALKGDLVTKLNTFTGDFTGDKEITLKWETKPEFYCTQFELERSENGRDFEVVQIIPSKGFLTDKLTKYSLINNGSRNIYFYRLKVINENPDEEYYHEFYSETIVVRRSNVVGLEVLSIFPNPFIDVVDMTFTDIIQEDVLVQIFDAKGALALERNITPEGTYLQVDGLKQLPPGKYFMSVQIGLDEPKTFPIVKTY